MSTYNRVVAADSSASLAPTVRARLATEMADPASDVGASLSDTYALDGSPFTFSPLPNRLNNEWRYQQASYSQSNIVTLADGTQYAVWINDSIRPIVGKRVVGSSQWTTYDLRDIAGDPFGAQAADGHNTFTIGVDDAGRVHVSGNMHNDPLKYARTNTPGDISAWTAGAMVGSEENAVAYPRFFNTPGGQIFFLYRQGGSGSGNLMLNRLVGSAWERAATVVDGTTDSVSPYENWAAVDVNGGIHIFFMWRTTGDAETNSDISYAFTPDGGVTWAKSTGATYAMPIRQATAEVVWAVPQRSGLINQSGADVDTDGNPHAAFMMYDAGGNTQYFHLWHDGATWHNDQVTNFTTRVETLAPLSTLELTTARPQLICTNEGQTYILGMTQGDGWGGSAVIVDVTPGSNNRIAKLFDMNLGRWEPSYDQRALRERGEFNMLVTPLLSPAPSNSPYKSQTGWILSVGSKYLRRLFGTAVEAPNASDAKKASAELDAGENVGRNQNRGDVPSGTDLNAYFNPRYAGDYWIPAPGRSMINLPPGIRSTSSDTTALSAVLTVAVAWDSVTVQTIRSTDGTFIMQRTRQAGAWGTWYQMGVPMGFALAASGVDLFTLTPGYYQLQSTGTYANEPAAFASLGVAGTLKCIGYSGVVKTLELTTLDRTAVWETRAVSGAWIAWLKTR